MQNPCLGILTVLTVYAASSSKQNISLQFTNQLLCMQVNFPSVRYNTFSYALYIQLIASLI